MTLVQKVLIDQGNCIVTWESLHKVSHINLININKYFHIISQIRVKGQKSHPKFKLYLKTSVDKYMKNSIAGVNPPSKYISQNQGFSLGRDGLV